MSGEKSLGRGKWGEDIAATYLKKKGYHILHRNWRCRMGELDLVASKGQYLCFVEVKLRKSAAYGTAGEAVDWRKQRKLYAAARFYLLQNSTQLQPRFDVLEIYAPPGTDISGVKIQHLENAF
ncbi:MAG: YraN family protein [Lawsonibacter sp.]|jgi:putative endonuclease